MTTTRHSVPLRLLNAGEHGDPTEAGYVWEASERKHGIVLALRLVDSEYFGALVTPSGVDAFGTGDLVRALRKFSDFADFAYSDACARQLPVGVRARLEAVGPQAWADANLLHSRWNYEPPDRLRLHADAVSAAEQHAGCLIRLPSDTTSQENHDDLAP